MNKRKINIGGKDYEIGMNRKSIMWLENNGFKIEELDSKPITSYDLLFRAGFVMKHPDVDTKDFMDLYEEEDGDIGEVIQFLSEEYTAFLLALTDTKSKKKKLETI